MALVVNPRACAGPRARVAAAAERLRAETQVVAAIETRGDAEDSRRIAEAIEQARADVVVAAGGDGTVGLVLGALLGGADGARTALGILPLGTGNNAARSFGLRSLRRAGDSAAELAIGAIAHGARRYVDVGVVNGRPFLGAFAVGLDGEILGRRNRMQRELQRHLGPIAAHSGYGLYLACFALCVVAKSPRWRARLALDGGAETRLLYNVVVANAPVYAGPLRFDGANDCADGLIDLHAVASARQYVAEYPRAWSRYLRALRGSTVSPSPLLRRARTIALELERPVAALVDGEELGAGSSYRLHVVPRAIRVCTAAVTTPAGADRSR